MRSSAAFCRDLLRDARYGVRTLLKSPGFALVTIAALAVGIGANLTIFGFVNALLLRPLAGTTDPHRLVRADLSGPNPIENNVVYDDYVAYRDRNQTLLQLAMFHPGGLRPVRVTGRAAETIHVMPVLPATVVGIAADSKYESISEEAKAFVYRPLAQRASPVFDATLFVKTSGDPRRAIPLVRGIVADLDPTLVLSNLNTLDDRLALAFLPNRAAAITSGLLGVIALGLGTIGTYSVMAFLVLQRRREIGIRIALGASPRSVVGMMTHQGARWIALGLGIGTVAAIGAVRVIAGLVLGVSAGDPVPAVVVLLLLGSAGYLACFVPAWRAGKADPVEVLRE